MRRLASLLLVSLAASPPLAAGTPAETGGAVHLADVFAALRQNAPSGHAARARADAARASADKAKRLPNPTAELRAENWRSGADASTDVDVFATLAQPLPFLSHGPAKGEAAALSRAAAARARQEENALLRRAARLYLDAARGQRLAAALAESRDALSGVVTILGKRVAEGWTAEGDLLKLRAELARAEGQLTRTRLAARTAALELSALLGPGTALDATRFVLPEPPALPEGDPGAVAKDAVRTRPDVAAAAERLAAAEEAVRLEKARRIPEPSLTAGYKRTGGLDTALAGIAFPLPLFDTNAAGVARASAEARAARFELTALEEAARAEAEALLFAARALGERARAAEAELLAPALGARQAARAAFREGASEVLPFVDAERVTAEAVREALDLAVDATLHALDARLALGQEVVP